MKKFLLNFSPCEPLALVQELPFFDNMIMIKNMLSSSLDMCFHDLISGCMFHEVRLSSISVNCYATYEVSNNSGKHG
jgi:hypothetical protein